MSAKATNSANYPSVSWADTLDLQRSALRWDVKRAMKSLCSKLEEIGEECFVVTVNVSNGWVGHLGTIRGDEYIDEKSHILYDFLNYCAESLRDDECEDNVGDDSSDTESCAADDNEGKSSDKDENKPIQISLPSPSNVEINGSDDNQDYVVVETPIRYLNRQPRQTAVSHGQFLLLNPVDLPCVSQPVAMATDTQAEHLVVDKSRDNTESSAENSASKGQKKGSKRKQRFEDIVPNNKDKQHTATRNEKGDSQKNKQKTEDASKISKKKVGYHGNKVDSDETDSVASETGSDVCESDRVLRSTNLQGKKAVWKTLLQKPGQSDGSDDEDDEEHVWKDGGNFEADDVNDEDWAQDVEDRDRLGRFLPSDTLNTRKKRKKKRRKSDDSHVSDETLRDWTDEPSNITCDSGGKLSKKIRHIDSSLLDQDIEFAKPNKDDSVKRTEETDEGISQDTDPVEREGEKSTRSKPRKRKSKLSSREKWSGEDLQVDSELHVELAGSSGVNDEEIREELLENSDKNESGKRPSKRPSLKRKLRNVANENWAVVDDSGNGSKTKK